MDSAQGSYLAPFFGDVSQSEKHSEIKPPLRMKFIKSLTPLWQASNIRYPASSFACFVKRRESDAEAC